jgi:hypothetical protein
MPARAGGSVLNIKPLMPHLCDLGLVGMKHRLI